MSGVPRCAASTRNGRARRLARHARPLWRLPEGGRAYSMVKRPRAFECLACRGMAALIWLLPGVLAGQASGSAPTPHVEVGAIAGMGGWHLPKQYWGVGVWSPTWRARRIEVGAMVALLREASRHDYVVAGTLDGPELDTSYVSSMARVGAEMRVGLSAHVAGVVRGGMVLGNWRDLPKSDASRSAYFAPFGALGAAATGRRWAFDAMLVGWKFRVGRPSRTASLEATIRRRL